MTKPLASEIVRAAHARYWAGASSVAVARDLGCHSSTLRKAWTRAGLPLRDAGGAMALRMAGLTAAERAALAAPAQDAVRGRKASRRELMQRAKTREARLLGVGPDERTATAILRRNGLSVELQKAVGIYNVDVLAAGTVAVEILGGQWHSGGRAAARHESRTRALLGAGLHVVMIWVTRADLRWRAGLDVARALAALPASAARQYRVVLPEGDTVVACDATADGFPLKPPRR